MERDRARVGATIVCGSRLVRGRRSGSRPPTSSHDVGGLRGEVHVTRTRTRVVLVVSFQCTTSIFRRSSTRESRPRCSTTKGYFALAHVNGRPQVVHAPGRSACTTSFAPQSKYKVSRAIKYRETRDTLYFRQRFQVAVSFRQNSLVLFFIFFQV